MYYNNNFQGGVLIPYYGYEEFEEVKNDVNLHQVIMEKPAINFSILEHLSHENKLAYKRFVVKKYGDWWKKVEKLKEDNELIEGIFEKYKYIFNEDISMKTQISNKFDEEFLKEGLIKGELYVISAPSGVGKTSFSIMLTSVLILGNNCFKNSLFDRRRIVYVSLEQSKVQIKARIKATLLALNDLKNTASYTDLFLKNVDISINELADSLYSMCEEYIQILTIEDFYDLDVENIISKLSHNLYDADIVVIDQYENINDSLNPLSDEVAKKLKAFAQSESICLILQSQINKNSIQQAKNNRGDYEIQKFTGNSLRGTSGLEHQASAILFIAPTSNEKMIDNHEAKLVEISIAKNRYGVSNKTIQMWFLGDVNLFLDKDYKNNKEIEGIIDVKI